MRVRKRLTREESKDLTCRRLIEAAERLFVRKGFDDASVEEVPDRRGPKALDDMFQRLAEPAERIAAVRKWFSNRWRLEDFIALRMEFSRRARRDRSARNHLVELRRRELKTYAAFVDQYLGATAGVTTHRPKIVALVLSAVVHSLASLMSMPSVNVNTWTARSQSWCSIA